MELQVTSLSFVQDRKGRAGKTLGANGRDEKLIVWLLLHQPNNNL